MAVRTSSCYFIPHDKSKIVNRKYDALSLATPEAFHSNPSRVWQFYHMRMIATNTAQPNEAHKALAKASKKGIKLITQNVDGLSRRVHESGVCLEMHGCGFPSLLLSLASYSPARCILETVCTTCKTRQTHNGETLCDALIGTETLAEETIIPITRLPHCSTCSTSPDGRKGLLRPGVVWFGASFVFVLCSNRSCLRIGEQPRHMKEITTLLSECDLLLVVGTSSTVYPAAGFSSIVKAQGGKIAAL